MALQRIVLGIVGWCLIISSSAFGQTRSEEVPKPLQEWKTWALWDDTLYQCPTPYNDNSQPLCIWPSTFQLKASAAEATWSTRVRVFAEAWVPLPGNDELWPQNVTVDGTSAAVLPRESLPAIRLSPGEHSIEGKFLWASLPEKIALPGSYGIVELSIDDQAIAQATWDDEGYLWLKRIQANQEESDQIEWQTYRVIEDGSPLWLRTQIDLSVSGKSREESLNYVLPEGWSLSFVSSPIPVAIDEKGLLKAQVRSGTWTIQIDAFRNQDLTELRYAADVQPNSAVELVGLRSRPETRTVELQGAQPVDAQMTRFPDAWRNLPVYEWRTDQPLKWLEKSNAADSTRQQPFQIERRLWLDESGTGITYEDKLQGEPRKLTRLDVASSHELGVVRMNGERQLITLHPSTRAAGVELRSSKPKIEAVGRAPLAKTLSATGWQSDASSLSMTWYLPPGWRMFALFGADHVEGDWLTAWSLLDLFLLLIFSIAVFRLWGWKSGVIAFIAFGLSYHEPGSPRLTWLFLLIPAAILKVIPQGKGAFWINVWRYIALAFLLLNLVPFAANQIQHSLFPQLERVGVPYSSRSMFEWLDSAYNAGADVADLGMEDYNAIDRLAPADESIAQRAPDMSGRNLQYDKLESKAATANMQYAPGSSIQTGMAKPTWSGNQILCYWDGPVSEQQTVRPILISCTQHRLFTIVRLVLLGLLAYLFLGKFPSLPKAKVAAMQPVATAILTLLAICVPSTTFAQIPDQATLNQLRERLLKPSDAFPHAADIASMQVKVEGNQLTMSGSVHAALDVAIPIPGRFPVWSPIRVQVDEQPALVCRRDDGYLWVWMSEGVHTLSVEGLISESSEWVLDLTLTPRSMQIDAPEWNITGLSADGRPEEQLFFVKKEQASAGEATYDQKNFRSIAVIDRQIEVGLVWRVHNTVRRLSASGKAIALQVPLLAGERILTGNVRTNQGMIDVSLGADDSEFVWESELAIQNELTLEAKLNPQAVERWSLLSSPVWNATFEGKQPIFETVGSDLVPVWNPWPSESTKLVFNRPEPAPGKTLTVQRVDHSVELGNGRRTGVLQLQVESSLGGDFAVTLPESTDVTKVMLDERPLPVRKVNSEYVVGLQPGSQSVTFQMQIDEPLANKAALTSVKLPTDAANIIMRMVVPDSRWILWAHGPMRGPAVRFWSWLVIAIVVALCLGSRTRSMLSRFEWVLLALGLTQVHAVAGLIVVGWLLLIDYRGSFDARSMNGGLLNLLQLSLILLTAASFGIFLVVVGRGLLGSPEMFLIGNQSYGNDLKWFAPVSGPELPQPWVLSVSVWYYQLLMLAWALWLANALIRWIKLGWQAFSRGGTWSSAKKKLDPVSTPST